MLARRPLLCLLLSANVSVMLACAQPGSPVAGAPQSRTRLLPPTILEPSAEVPIEVEDLRRGSRSAAVTIVAFLDLECPFCATGFDVASQVTSHFGPERVALVIKHLPLGMHPHALAAARRSLDVQRSHGNPVAFDFLRSVLAEQTQLDDAWLGRLQRDVTAQAASASPSGFSLPVEEQLARDLALAAKLGIAQTPTFLINGILLEGAPSVESLTGLVTEELKAVEALRRAQIPDGSTYARRVRENFRPATATSPEATEEPLQWAIPLGNSPSLGSGAAPVTVIAFLDLECPYCSQGYETLQKLQQKYPEQVRLVWKHRPLPFHQNAEPAARLLEEVRQEHGDAAFFQAAKVLFGNQADLGELTLTRLATELKLTRRPAPPPRPLDDPDPIEQDLETAEDFGVMSTPQLFLNGQRLAGSRSLAELSVKVEAELARARDLAPTLDAGTALGTALMKDAKPAPPPTRVTWPAVIAPGLLLGDHHAKVTIHVFSDYQCPFCKQAHAVIDRLLIELPKDVKVAWHDFPLEFHEHARRAASLARAAYAKTGAKGFPPVLEQLFAHQEDLSEATLGALAKTWNLEPEGAAAATRETVHGAAIEKELEFARSLGVTSTPTLVIGNYLVEGLKSERTLRRLIRLARSEQTPKKPVKLASAARNTQVKASQ